MKYEISQSSILAAREIVKDQKIISANKKLYSHYISTFAYTSGKEHLIAYGRDLFEELNQSDGKDLFAYRKSLRKLLMKILKHEKDSSIYAIPRGSIHFFDCIDENFKQIFIDAGLNQKITNTDESKEIRDWWLDMKEYARNLSKEKMTVSGKTGEDKTFDYEIDKLKKLKIFKEPEIISVHDEEEGYDVLSWNDKIEQIFIESKATVKLNGRFFLTRNEWNTAKTKKEKYFVYVWIKELPNPRIINFKELSELVSPHDTIKSKNSRWPKLEIVPRGKN